MTKMEQLVVLSSVLQLAAADDLICHYCTHSRKSKDVHDGENQNPDCMNKLKFGSREEMRRLCTPLEEYCASTVTNLNGFLVLVERGCAEECIPGCEAHGFGLFWQECTRCCNSSLCNEWDGRDYYKPNGSFRTTNWPFFLTLHILRNL